MKSNIFLAGLAATILLVSGCSDSASTRIDEPEETILAQVGDKTISVNEFIRRAEYTMRPEYCMRDNYVHKKIVLNSLIAEKLFSLAGGPNPELADHEEFQAFLRGRKEQAMRRLLIHDETDEDLQVDTAAIRNAFQRAGRTYQVRYINIPENRYLESHAARVKSDGRLSGVYRELYGPGEIPEKKVTWQDASLQPLHEALYAQPVAKSDIIGPVRSVDGVVTFMKVTGWTDRKVISDTDIRDRWNTVRERLEGYEVAERFDAYVSEIMAGKRLEFNREIFFTLVELFAPVYLRDEEEKEAMANAVFWDKQAGEEIFDNVQESIDKYRDFPLLQIDGEIWTVHNFVEAQKSHPLVFRTKSLTRKNFAKQFKLAIVDLVRDQYLTEAAYRRGYDQINIVERDLAMWSDHMESLAHRNQYLRDTGFNKSFGKHYMQAIEEHLNPYVDELQDRYSKQIAINYEAFEKIQLSRIDMFATLENVPYPVAVPSFPVLTTDHRLDYGDIIN